MQINVRYLDNLKIEASFDDYSIIADQPVRYKGDGTAPGPFDYFLASSAMCAAYFVKVYCQARDIPTDDIKITQNNLVDPDNRYHQDIQIQIQLPEGLSEKDKTGILKSMDRCTVKRVIDNQPKFLIDALASLDETIDLDYEKFSKEDFKTLIPGKDCTLEETITKMRKNLSDLGINIEIASWRNPVPNVWSVHIRDADSPLCYTNGKGATQNAALASALGEYLERISNNYFYNDFFLGPEVADSTFVHYPNEKWFEISSIEDEVPQGLMDEYMLNIYNPEDELRAGHLIDPNSGRVDRGICALPYIRQSDQETVYIPVNLIGNLFVSNGMSAGNTKEEARVQALSEIFERAIKNRILTEEIALPEVPAEVLERFPTIVEGIKELENQGFPILVKDASLGGKYPVMCVTLMNPKTGGVFASFGAHPKLEVALERSLTELMQGRSFQGMDDVPAPTFNEQAVTEHNNIIDHFIDSTGVVSWRFFSSKADYEFTDWNFSGSTEEEFNYLMDLLGQEEKEVYIYDTNELGSWATRILVPDFSEIYLAEDLMWDNSNRALAFREDILNIHDLSNEDLNALLERFDEFELDDYMAISELIGISFDETSAWGRLTVGELKALSFLKLQEFDLAKNAVETYLAFNDNTPARRKFYQVLNILLDIEIEDDLEFSDYENALTRMYGKDLLEKTLKTLRGETPFEGLTKTNMNLEGLPKHQRLVESYLKLHKKRS